LKIQNSKLFLAILLTSSLAFGQGRVECSAVKSAILARPVKYCALLPPSYGSPAKTYPVLYFLHGLGDNEQSLVASGAWNIIERLRETGKIGEMVVVTPAGDRSFYINSRDGRVRYEDFFIREFVPEIERRYHAGGARAHRAVGGVSMGGYGALRFAFKYPQLFAAVAVHMAAIYDRLPPALAAAAAADPRGRRLDAAGAFGNPPDEAYWQANSPLRFARSAPLQRLAIYFDCGDRDDYGFDAGARALDQALTARHVPHEFHLYPGGHDWMYVADHFGDAIQFEWRALSAGPRPAGAGRKTR
jgi:S-formylglutathione hydrolase FrmB